MTSKSKNNSRRRLARATMQGAPAGSQLGRMMVCSPRTLVSLALANKMKRLVAVREPRLQSSGSGRGISRVSRQRRWGRRWSRERMSQRSGRRGKKN